MASIRANENLAVQWFKRTLGSESIEVGIIRESPEFNGGGTNSPGPRMNWSGKGEAFRFAKDAEEFLNISRVARNPQCFAILVSSPENQPTQRYELCWAHTSGIQD